MDLDEAKKLGLELQSKLPWQEIADSPTVRYYTDWEKFAGFKPAGSTASRRLGPCEVSASGQFAGCSGVVVTPARQVFREVSINSRILALHAAALQNAVEISISAPLERPLVVRLEAAGPPGGHVASHVVLHAAPGASGVVVVVAESGADVMHTAVVEGDVWGQLDYVMVSRGGGPQYVHSALSVFSSLRARPLAVGGVMNAVREEYRLGERAAVDVVGLELGFGSSRIDHVVSVINEGRESRGAASLYAVAADKSFVSQRAVGRIAKSGVLSENSVSGVVYIASEEATANTQPVILVETGEVAGARHSAADAALDEDGEYYLRTRGVRREDLGKLLVASFIDIYLSAVPDSARELVLELANPLHVLRFEEVGDLHV